MRAMIKQVLSDAGFDIVGEAENGEDAITKFRELKPDLVTMDIVMPDLDGISAVGKIVAENPDARIIVCSAMGQEALLERAVSAGAKGYIVKPFSPPQLLEVVERALG
jgi:two-component system chemotaxis response regulator CheY